MPFLTAGQSNEGDPVRLLLQRLLLFDLHTKVPQLSSEAAVKEHSVQMYSPLDRGLRGVQGVLAVQRQLGLIVSMSQTCLYPMNGFSTFKKVDCTFFF